MGSVIRLRRREGWREWLVGLAVVLGFVGVAKAANEDTCGYPNTPDTCTYAVGSPLDVPPWSQGRDGSSNLQVCADDPSDGCTTSISFAYRKETSCLGSTAFGHGEWNPNRAFGQFRDCGDGVGAGWFMPRQTVGTTGYNTLVWRVGLDGYNGVAVGQQECSADGTWTCAECCSGTGDPADCHDLAQGPWGGSFKHVLFKSFDFRNAVKCDSSQHDDVLQQPIGGQQIDGWVVFQDGYLVNGDSAVNNSKGWDDGFTGSMKGIVYQNVVFGVEPDYQDDCANRGIISGGASNCGVGGGPLRPKGADIEVWLIGLQAHGNGAGKRVLDTASGGDGSYTKIVVIDTASSAWTNNTGVTPTEYASLEEAAQSETLPPFVWMSCTGWDTPPENCVTSRGVDEAIFNDTDGDLVNDCVDNCLETANPLQIDTDSDDLGNACDPDVADTSGNGPGDNVVGLPDYSQLLNCIGVVSTDSEWTDTNYCVGLGCRNCDFTDDNAVGLPDLGVYTAYVGKAPGPGAESCQ